MLDVEFANHIAQFGVDQPTHFPCKAAANPCNPGHEAPGPTSIPERQGSLDAGSGRAGGFVPSHLAVALQHSGNVMRGRNDGDAAWDSKLGMRRGFVAFGQF